MARTRIGVACPIPGERAAYLEWLSSAGYEPVPMIDSASIIQQLEGEAFQVLIVDVALVARPDAGRYLAMLGVNRPLLVVGDDQERARAEARKRDATFLARPVSRELLLMSVTLALAEGRPARRSRRHAVGRIPATIDQVPSSVLDVSNEGLRLELADTHRSALPPIFRVYVPNWSVGVVVQRVWVCNAPRHIRERSIWCGGLLKKNSGREAEAWRLLVEHAPASAKAATFEIQ